MIQRSDPVPDLRRLRVFFAAIAFVMAVIVVRLWFLQIVKGPEFATIADTQRKRLIRRPAARGTILDAKGRPLAISRPQFVISVIPEEVKKSPETYTRLAQMLHLSEDELQSQIKKTKDKEGLVAADSVPVVKDASIELISQIEEQKVDLPGILITKDPVRYYVDNKLCTHILGYARAINSEELKKENDKGLDYHGGDVIGKDGLEKTYESDLRGKDGEESVAVNARGKLERVLDETAPVPGHTLKLTIDADLQQTAYDALQTPLAERHAGAAVAIDPNDGAVLAMVSTPSYDANSFTQKFHQLQDDKLHPLINRAAGSGYPCGSTFKIVTAAAGLETGTINPNTRYYCPGSLRVGNRNFRCDGRHGSLNMYQAIAKSCDVYFYHVGEGVGHEQLAFWARHFGLGEKTGIDLPADSPGLIPTPEWKKKTRRGPWVQGDLVNMAIGQGAVLVTPLQLACYTAAVANGGTLLRPQLVREIDDISSGKLVKIHSLERQVRAPLGITQQHRDAIVEGMQRVIQPGGTGQVLRIPGLDFAGKTGSAQMIWEKQQRTNSVFICFAPVDHPTIAIAVLVEGAGRGMECAGPICRRMLCAYFHKNVPPVPIRIGNHGGD